MSQYNVDLMLAVREQITSHPETHHQASWARRTECDTTHCIAGWACVLSGAQLLWEEGKELSALVVAGGVPTEIPGYAEDLLGLSSPEASDLFYAGREDALAKLDALIEKGKNQP